MSQPNRARLLSSALSLLLILSVIVGCVSAPTAGEPSLTLPNSSAFTAGVTAPDTEPAETLPIASLSITNCDRATLAVGESLQLITNAGEENARLLVWSVSNSSASVSDSGRVTALEAGKVTVTVTYGELRARALIEIVDPAETDPPADIPTYGPDAPAVDPDLPEVSGSPEGYRPAGSAGEAQDRAEQGLPAGYLYVPDQAPVISPDRPMQNGQYIRNTALTYVDEDTYVVVNAAGEEVFRVYRGGGYITLEEIAAYLYAFGDVPANYNEGKKLSPDNSIWGEYLRLNHSKFSGNTQKYPYEPMLPRISGCGGDLQYYEIDIGTTGTDCDPGYSVRPYNDGVRITRGAARIVYARFDANGNAVIDPEEKYVFYTYNHYNDFREYLGYYNGWGEMFGNITGGGELSSKYNYNPTPYIPTVTASLTQKPRATILCCDLWRREDAA